MWLRKVVLPASYKFSDGVRIALHDARQEASRLGHVYVGTEHVLLGLAHQGDDTFRQLLEQLGVSVESIVRHIEGTVPRGKAGTRSRNELPYTSRAKKVLELAMGEAHRRQAESVGTDHLLIGLLREEKGMAAQTLVALGATLDSAIAAIEGQLPRRARFTMQIDDQSEKSIYEQIVSRVQESVATGALEPGERLPTVRQLADELDIAPGTVARAYSELERLRVVISEGTRGTRVAPRDPPAIASSDRPQTLVGLLRPVAVAAFHLGSTAAELRLALDVAMQDIFTDRDAA